MFMQSLAGEQFSITVALMDFGTLYRHIGTRTLRVLDWGRWTSVEVG